MDGLSRLDLPRPVLGVLGQKVRDVNRPGQAPRPNFEGRDEIQPKQRQVGQVIVIQSAGLQVRVNQAQAAQAISSLPIGAKIWKKNGMRISDHGLTDVSPPVD